MITNFFNRAIVIKGSPVELVVVGTKGDLNGVLVRTENTQLDLVGFALSDSKLDGDDFETRYSRFTNREMNAVESYPLDQIPELRENRKSGYKLCWVGYCSHDQRTRIEKVFNRHIADIKVGIDNGEPEIIETGLAPVIYHCQMVHLQYKEKLKNSKFRQYALYIFVLVLMSILTLILGLNFVAYYLKR